MKIGTAKAMDDRVMQDSVVQWIKSMPEGWQVGRLKNVSTIKSSNVDKKSYPDQMPVRLCNYVDVYYNDVIDCSIEFMKSTASAQEFDKFHLNYGNVVITKDSETPDDIAVPSFVAEDIEDLVCGYHLAVIKAGYNLNGKFLFRVIQAAGIKDQFYRLATGITRFGLKIRELESVLIPIPMLSEQQTIAHYLDQQCGKLDAVIAIKQQQIKTLDALRQSVIYQAVTKGLDATVPLVGSGVEWLGDIPLGWRIERLKDIANINENTLDAKTPDDYLLQYIEISNVNSQGIVSDQAIEEIEFSAAPSRAKRRVFPGDTIISSVRPNLQAIAYIERDESNLVCSTGFYVVNTKFTHLLDNKFAYYFLLSVNSKQYFESVAKGVGYPSVDDRDFKSLYTMLPPVAEQQAIADHLDQETQRLDTLKANLNQQISTLQAYKKSLIYECVTGKKRLAGYA